MNPIPRKAHEEPRSLTLKEVAEFIGGELVGRPEIRITGVAGIREAEDGDITFLSNPKYLPHLEDTRASAIIAMPDAVAQSKNLIRTPRPSEAFTKMVSFFRPSQTPPKPGVHATAVLGANVALGREVSIGPYAVIEDDVTIGDRSIIEAQVFIGTRSRIGADAHIYPQVTVREETRIGDRVIIHSGSVIGSDGFGYETIEGRHLKIPQIGCVWIEDDVEIGSNVSIDRGRFQKTWIRRGVKIDNLVQIAHNVVIGENSLVISQVGISGSTELGQNVILAGQAGVVGHIRLGDGVVVGAGAGVTKSVPDNTVVLGSPAKPIAEQKRIFALIAKLPELFSDLAVIKKKLKNPS